MDSIPDFVLTQEFFWSVLVAGIAVNFICEGIRRLFSNGYLLVNKKLREKYEKSQANKASAISYHSSSYEKLLILKVETLQSHFSAIVTIAMSAIVYTTSHFIVFAWLETFFLVLTIITLIAGLSLFFRHIQQLDMCIEAERILKDKDMTK